MQLFRESSVSESKNKKPAAQVAAGKLGKEVQRARARTSLPMQLYGRHEVVALLGLSFPTVWAMMRRNEFPRGRVVGGKTKWLSTEVDAWLNGLEKRRLKGDAEPEAVA
jgi:predicted DNA-binding transcriptional regulator AlpA